MRIKRLILTAYGRCRDVGVDIGDGLTVVLGSNEAGKSTSLDALGDLLWGIPRGTPRASEFGKAQLRIDAVLAVDGQTRTVVRKPTGLFAGDLATQIPSPWDPDNRLTAQWWRTRLGINHSDLRRGGNDVFTGNGDLADVIFAAREGHSAREVLKEITDQADRCFKPDGRAKKVQLRLAADEYKRTVADRESRLTRADAVMEQRKAVDELEAKHRHLCDEVTATSQALKREEENRRVIGSVLELHRAQSEVDAIDAEGDRLSPRELTEYNQASAECRRAEERTTKLDNEIDSKSGAIDALSVDDRLLDDRTTFNRLQPDVKARVEDLRRAGEEFGTAVEEAATQLRQLLGSIGIEALDDLDRAVDGARIRGDHAAALSELAERIECLEHKRQQARDERDTVLNQLLMKGITVEIAASAAPDEEAISRLRKALADARNSEATAVTLLTEATEAVQVLESSAANPPAEFMLTHNAVLEARSSRNAHWNAIRRSWVTGELPGSADRVDIAAEFDTRLADSDKIADDEAAERSRVAALDARLEVQVEGLEAARQKQRDATAYLEAEVGDRCNAENEWAAAWTSLGIASVPDVDNSSVVAGLLATAHVEHARERSAAEQIADVSGLWRAAAELAGLPATTTATAWRRRAQVLADIETVAAQRARDRKLETQARGRWDEFMAEAVGLLRRHEVIDRGQPVTPAVIEQGFAKLSRQLEVATGAEAKRASYFEQIVKIRAEREEVRQAQQDAVDALQRLVELHAVSTEQDLVMLAERARRAAEPLEERQESKKAIKNGLGPGSDLANVAGRLAGCDEATVQQAVAQAQLRDDEARQDADRVLTEYTSARDRLVELEEAAGAADAEAAVVSRQAEVARLTETWAILALQRKLLEDVLEGFGSSDTRPLLDHAGQLLERLTDGRWVALRAEDDGVSRKLRVMRADNTPCDTGQLSEGTADQVFFAVRLAAVAELHNERVKAGDVALPLVLDDVLMAFDEVRVRSALEILASLAPGLQVIVFTHHQHVAEAAAAFGQIKVSALPAAASIADPLDGELIRARAQQGAGWVG
jgi:hypothetical protein